MDSSARHLIATLLFCFCPLFVVGDTTPSAEPSLAAFTTSPAWETDYARALERARHEQKPVLLNFTGSDWCVWCHRLRDEVFTRPPFLDYANDHLVLVELDFPNRKPQPDETRAQNHKLKEQFKVTSYPTVILIDAEGRELGRTGYVQGGPKTFVRELKRFAAKPPAPSS